MIGLDDENVRSLRTALNGGHRDHRFAALGLDQNLGIDELVGEQRAVRVVEHGAHLDGAGGGADLAVRSHQAALGQFPAHAAVIHGDGKPVVFVHARQHVADGIFGDGKQHGNRIHLGHHGDAGTLAGADVVAEIDAAQTDAPGYRRHQPRETELDRRAFHRRFIGIDRAFVLLGGGFGGIQILLRRRMRGEQRPLPFEFRLCIDQRRPVLGELPLRLVERRLVAARIDDRKAVAGTHHLPLAKIDPDDLAADLRGNGGGGERRNRPQCAQGHVDVAFDGLGHAHGLRLAHGAAAEYRYVAAMGDGHGEQDDQDDAETDPQRHFAARQVTHAPAAQPIDGAPDFAKKGTAPRPVGERRKFPSRAGGRSKTIRAVVLAIHGSFHVERNLHCYLHDGPCHFPSLKRNNMYRGIPISHFATLSELSQTKPFPRYGDRKRYRGSNKKMTRPRRAGSFAVFNCDYRACRTLNYPRDASTTV